MTSSASPYAGGIFISYRRDDTAYPAGWLFDQLADQFGSSRVFKDVDSIRLGDDFVEQISSAVGSCAVLLAVIGVRWLAVTGDRGRRLDDPEDFVRIEIEAALRRDIRVIPVLVDGAHMPTAADLPPSLEMLTRRQALDLSPSRFHADISHLLRVLEGIVSLTESHPAPARSRRRCRVVGTPVSYGLTTFKDRDDELRQILQWLTDPATRLVTIFGRRGIGKSALAAKAVQTLSENDSRCSGIVNLSTRSEGPLSVERIFFACTELADPSERESLLRLWRSRRDARDKMLDLFAAMDDGRHVLVLDNIEDQLTDDGRPANADLKVFLDVVFRAPRAPTVLTTTQVPLALDPALRRWEARLHLDNGLPVDECVDFLRELDRSGDAGLLTASYSDLERTARRLYGVPRALELAVGVLTADDVTLPTLDGLLNEFTARGDVVNQLAHDRSRRLDSEARLTLSVIAVFRTPVTQEQVEWVLQPWAPSVEASQALRRLVQVHMVSVNRRSREFTLHPLDADIAYGALVRTGPAGRQDLERRVAAWFQRQCLPPPWRTVDEVASHRRQFEHLLRAEDYDEAALILDQIGEFLTWQGSIREVVGMHLAIHDHLHSDAAVLAHLVGYAQTRHIGGPMDEAIAPLQEAIALGERIGDRRQLGRALFSLGDVFRALRRLPEAVDVLTRSAELAHDLDDSLLEGHSLLCLSLTYSYLNDIPAGLEIADRMDLLAEHTNHPMIRAQAGDARSAAYIVAGRWADALAAAEHAVASYEQAGVLEALGYARNTQGIALLGMGRLADAIALLRQARSDGTQVESPRAEGLCLYNLAWAYWTAGRHVDACDTANQATEAFRRSAAADIDAAESLVDAARAAVADDRPTASAALRTAASKSRGNSDLVPAAWLLAEADRRSTRSP
jgi:tetratricopeptide (TPR) repeat protein